MKIKVITDVHMGATNEMFTKFQWYINEPDVYFIGDNIDLANCKKKDVHKYQLYRENLKDIYGSNWIDGNHERSSTDEESIILTNERGEKTILRHGDYEADKERWIKYRRESQGAGFLKRAIWVNAIEIFEDLFQRGIKEKFVKNAVKIAKENGCKRYICGHFHPKNKITLMQDGIEIIILPRGLNEVLI